MYDNWEKGPENREFLLLKKFPVILILLLFLFIPVSYGKKKEKKVSASESILMHDEFISVGTYRELAKEQAINKALEKEFGSTVVSNYEQIRTTTSTGQRQVDTHQDIRHNYVNTFPNGKWLKPLKESEYEQLEDENGNMWMKCTVVGLAEPIESATVNFISKILGSEDPSKNSRESFTSGESGYIYFKSPVDGYIAIYFDDLNRIQRCLPYNAYDGSCFRVKANKDYLFFSTEKCDYLKNKGSVDEVEFFTDRDYENNRFYILFSPVPILAPLLKKPEKMEGGYSSFWHTESHLFMQWLEETRIRNKQLQVQIIWITIKKEES